MNSYLAVDTSKNLIVSIANGATRTEAYDKAQHELLNQNFEIKFRVSEITALALVILGIVAGITVGILAGAAIGCLVGFTISLSALIPLALLWGFSNQQEVYAAKMREEEANIGNILTKAVEFISSLRKLKATFIVNKLNKDSPPASVWSTELGKNEKRLIHQYAEEFNAGKCEFSDPCPVYEDFKQLGTVIKNISEMDHSHCVPISKWRELHNAITNTFNGEYVKENPNQEQQKKEWVAAY